MNNQTNLDDWSSYVPDPSTFNNLVIMVTGAADGIGRALTIALAEQGTTVLMLDKKARHLEKLYDQITERGWQEPVILPVDLMDLNAESATTLAQAVANDFGSLNALVHVAGELGSPSPLDQYDLEYWQQVMQTNLQSPYLLTRALLPLLKLESDTQIIFSSAQVGRNPKAYGGAYSIAYAGLEAQMKIWSQELENVSNIKVNSIDPGAVRTVMRRRSHPGENQDSLRTPQQTSRGYLKLIENKTALTGCSLVLN